MVLPSFLICGAQKSGTTSLQNYLAEHPDIFIPDMFEVLHKAGAREVHFFDINYDKGVEWYEKNFAGHQGEAAVGEKTPKYIYDPLCPRRIYDVLPNAKLIFLLRDPADRAYSHYRMRKRNGAEKRGFMEAAFSHDSDYIDRGYYDIQLQRYLDLFPRGQMRIYTLRELKQQTLMVYQHCCEYIGVDPKFIPETIDMKHNVGGICRSTLLSRIRKEFKKHNMVFIARLINAINLKRGSYPPMKKKDRKTLIEHYKPHIERLEEQFPHLNLEHWEKLKP